MKHKAAPWKIVYIVIALAIIFWIDLVLWVVLKLIPLVVLIR